MMREEEGLRSVIYSSSGSYVEQNNDLILKTFEVYSL